MVWGLIYEEGDDVYVKTYARFARRAVSEDMTFSASEVAFVARPTSDTVVFGPQLLTRDDLHKIELSYEEGNVLRSRPDKAAPGKPLPSFIQKCATCPVPKPGFYVVDRQGDWIKVIWQDSKLGGGEGWIDAKARIGAQSMDELMPELDFIQGAVGYLRYRVGEQGGGAPDQQATLQYALSDFDRFRENARDGSQSAYARSLELSGMLLAQRGQPDDIKRVREELEEATRLEPESGAARNLSACVQIWQYWRFQSLGEHAKAQADQLIAATILDSQSNPNLSNLRGLYRLLLSAPPNHVTEFSRSEIQERLQKIDSVLTPPPAN